MNKSIRTLVASLTTFAAAHAAPFLALGEGAELFLTATVGFRADDNIFLTSNETSDTIFDFNPGVELVFGRGSLTSGSFRFVENIARYSDNGNLDTELSSFSFNSKYDDGKTTFGTRAAYDQLNQNSPGLTGLTRRNVFAGGLDAEVSVTEKSSVGFGINYRDADYLRAGYSDLRTVTLPIDYYWAVSSKVDLSLGYRFRNSDVQTGLDSKDHFFRVGFRGEFSPNMTGSVKVGVGQRDFSGAGSEDILDLDASLDFKVSAKSTIRLTASNDFDVSGQGQQQKIFSFGGSFSSQVSEVLSLRAGLNFGKYDYYTREDDFVEGSLSMNYAVNRYLSIAAAYAYRNNDSGLANGDFRNNVFSLSANFRY
jgi:hypothetical protein